MRREDDFMAITVNCCDCGRYLFKTDEFHHMNISKVCKKCKKLITFHAETLEVTSKPIPQRVSSSGMRFY